MARPRTIDQTETDRFETPTLRNPAVPDKLPNVRPHRHRKPTWGQTWAEEIRRRDFRIYIMILSILAASIVGSFVILDSPTPVPSSSARTVVTPPTTVPAVTPAPLQRPRTTLVGPDRPKHANPVPTHAPTHHKAPVSHSRRPVTSDPGTPSSPKPTKSSPSSSGTPSASSSPTKSGSAAPTKTGSSTSQTPPEHSGTPAPEAS